MKTKGYIASLLLLLGLVGCTKEITLPTVELDFDQTSYSSVTGDATIIGRVTDDGGELTDAGICYIKAASGTPDVNDNRHSVGAKRDIKVELTGLAVGTYRVRAYATNRVGTAYSAIGELTITDPTTVPTVVWNTSSSSYNSSAGTASLYATVTSNGGAAVTAAGFCYIKGDSGTPTVSNSRWTSTSLTDIHVEVSNLTSGTYRMRPYATNSKGTGYGQVMTMTIDRSGGTTTYTQSDILGTWSCRAYNWDESQWENWSGLTITSINQSLDGFTSPVIVDGFEGNTWMLIVGDWDQANQCVRLKAGWAVRSRTWYYTSDTSTRFYDAFYPVYTSGSTYYWLQKYSNGDNAEALLKFNSSGQLVLSAAEQPDANGRYANGIGWKIIYADTQEEYEYRERIYTQVTMTKTSSKGGGGLVEVLPPPDPDGARPFRQR